MKKRPHHNYQPLGGQKSDRSLRPWAEVASLYTAQSGDRVTPKNAVMIANKGMLKLRAALMADPDIRERLGTK